MLLLCERDGAEAAAAQKSQTKLEPEQVEDAVEAANSKANNIDDDADGDGLVLVDMPDYAEDFEDCDPVENEIIRAGRRRPFS